MNLKSLFLLIVLTIAVMSCGCLTATVVKTTDTPTPLQVSATATIATTFSIHGTVHDYQGVPLSNAKVTLMQDGQVVNIPENPQLSNDGRTGSDGAFGFENLPKGEYTIIAEKDGYSGSISYSGDSSSADLFINNYGSTATVTPVPTQISTSSASSYNRSYTWSYKGSKWTTKLTISTSIYDYYKQQPHDRQSDYAEYALSDYDRTTLKSLIKSFDDAGTRSGYSEYDDVMNVVCFVQSLPYTSDKVTTGYDEYPRYPIETLVDNGGDCEDTAILTAALLHEMGYGVVMIKLPGHMAVGVKCANDYSGTYYDYKGARYYYLETTGENWAIGHMPDDYKNAKATIYPLVQIPKMNMNFNTTVTSDNSYVYYRVHCSIENDGPGTAKNATVYIAALALSQGDNRVWTPTSTISLGDYKEGSSGWAEATIKVPRNEESQIECMLYGDNFNTVTLKSNTFNT